MPRVVVPGCAHHVTQRGTNRGDIFLDDADRKLFIDLLREWAKKTSTGVWAYCLMDNHFHLLVVPAREDSLGKFAHGLTFRHAQHFNWKYGRTGRLWQNRYFSCPVDTGYVWIVSRYIERNPVRAGLTKNPLNWRWSSAPSHVQGRTDATLSQPDWLSDKDRPQYNTFLLSDGGEEENIRKTTNTGRPFGTPDFIRRLEATLQRRLTPMRAGRPRKEK